MGDHVPLSWKFTQYVEGSDIEVTCKVATKDGGVVSYSSTIGHSDQPERVIATIDLVAAKAVARARQ